MDCLLVYGRKVKINTSLQKGTFVPFFVYKNSRFLKIKISLDQINCGYIVKKTVLI